jgi:uncharacterized protein YxeA
MMKKNLIIIIIAVVALAILAAGYFWLANSVKHGSKTNLSLAQIMDIVKTDKDYNDFTSLVKNFDPELTGYKKFGPEEYKTLRADWEKQGLSDRNKLTDAVKLNDYTYWVELVNKNDKSRGLYAVIDTKEKKSLLIIASISIEAGIGYENNSAVSLSGGL